MSSPAIAPVHRSPVLHVSEPDLHRREFEDLVQRLDSWAVDSDHFFRKPLARLDDDDVHLPRYLYLGPRGGGEYIRVGIFASIHGDEPEGALALERLVARLEEDPQIALDYALFLYPVCNPRGFVKGTRHSQSGKDLHREFWKGSDEPEVRALETELWSHAFQGIVTLHSDDTSDGLYGFVNGEVLSENLLDPALRAAEQYLPRNLAHSIDGFSAHRGIIHEGYLGTLRAVPNVKPRPFEITFETPKFAPQDRQVAAAATALETILVEYRQFMAISQSI